MPKMKCTNKFLAGFLLGEITYLTKPSELQPDKIEQVVNGIPVGYFLTAQQRVQPIPPPAKPRVGTVFQFIRHQHRQSRIIAEVVITRRVFTAFPTGEADRVEWRWVYHFEEVKLKHKGA